MRIAFTAEDLAFRNEVRRFFAEQLPDDLRRRQRQGFQLSGDDMRRWQRILHDRGWAAPGWPVEHGGTGWTPTQQYIFEDETGAHHAPEPNVVAINLIGPVIWKFGSDEMKARFLPPILKGDMLGCQGFSEPDAGSDLASLRTRAVRDGDDYVITGQKIWTSEAQFADQMILLARTDPDVKPQAGLSMIMVPMDAPGVTVRPIRTINFDHNVNEVFLDQVRVPVRDLIGEPGKGWSYAKFLLTHERTYNAHVNRLKRDLDDIRALAARPDAAGRRAMDAESFRRDLARLETDVIALDWSVLRTLHGDMGAAGDSAASSLKIEGSELQIRASELAIRALGLHATPRYRNPASEPYGNDMPADAPDDAPGVVTRYLYRRASTIFGGSNDIQRALIWGGALATRR